MDFNLMKHLMVNVLTVVCRQSMVIQPNNATTHNLMDVRHAVGDHVMVLVKERMNMYISDKDKLSNQMGQFDVWCNKLFYWKGPVIGWRFIKDL